MDVQQDIGALTLTLRRLDPVWVARLLRPLLGLVFVGWALVGLALIAIAIATLGADVARGAVQLLAALLALGMGLPVLAGLVSPRLGYRMLGYQLRLSQTALELPGGLLVKRRTVPFDQLDAVRLRRVSALSWRGFWWGSGDYLELQVGDSAELIRIPLREAYREPLLALLQAHADGQRERLATAGHDLSAPATPPQALRALLER